MATTTLRNEAVGLLQELLRLNTVNPPGNESIAAEETFLFKPGGAGYGYETNPYRVVRFKNSTPYVMEPGPIAIFSM